MIYKEQTHSNLMKNKRKVMNTIAITATFLGIILISNSITGYFIWDNWFEEEIKEESFLNDYNLEEYSGEIYWNNFVECENKEIYEEIKEENKWKPKEGDINEYGNVIQNPDSCICAIAALANSNWALYSKEIKEAVKRAGEDPSKANAGTVFHILKMMMERKGHNINDGTSPGKEYNDLLECKEELIKNIAGKDENLGLFTATGTLDQRKKFYEDMFNAVNNGKPVNLILYIRKDSKGRLIYHAVQVSSMMKVGEKYLISFFDSEIGEYVTALVNPSTGEVSYSSNYPQNIKIAGAIF